MNEINKQLVQKKCYIGKVRFVINTIINQNVVLIFDSILLVFYVLIKLQYIVSMLSDR